MLFEWKTNVKLEGIISIELRYMNWLLLKIIRLALERKIKIKIDEVEWLWVKYVNDHILTAIRLLSTMRTSSKVK